MAIPVIAGWTANDNGGATTTSITLDKPSNVQVGDLLLIIVGSDNGNAADWNTLSGWTQFVNANSSAADAALACYWRAADGNEDPTIVVTAGSSDERIGWYLRITGANTTIPINVLGTPQSSGSAGSHDVNSINTDEDDCLAFYAIVVDGADTDPLTESNSGWSEVDEHNSGTASGDVCGAFGTKNMASQGATGLVTITLEGSADGATRVQFAIAPPGITYKLEGVTKDKNGNTKGTCKCFLCKDNGDNTASYVVYDESDGSGNYSFTGLSNNDASYFVISWKDDSPHVFDVTDHVLQPVEET